MQLSKKELLQAAALIQFLRETQGRLFTAGELRDAADQIETSRAQHHQLATKAAEWLKRVHHVESEVQYRNAIEYKLVHTYTQYTINPDFIIPHLQRQEKSFEIELPEAEGFPPGARILLELSWFDTGNW